MRRIFYSLQKAWQYRKALKATAQQTTQSITDIDLDQLKQQDISIVVFDFDGVLANHGVTEPLPPGKKILSSAVKLFGEDKVFILSNKPTGERKAYFDKHFPTIQFIKANRKKPYPDGLQQIINLTNTPPDNILLIDDRLLTGALAAAIAGTKVCHIKTPFVDIKHSPIRERFFMFLRWLENHAFG